MEQLETGTLLIHAKRLEETFEHVSRLSIRCMLNGNQYYKVGNQEALVTPKNYLVVNQGQHYKTSFSSDDDLEMMLVAFRPGFAEELLYSLITPQDKLLENPFARSNQPITFFEKTYETDPVISQLFLHLRKLIDEDISIRKETDHDGIYSDMLTRLLFVHRGLRKTIDKLDSVKHSTRTELFRRLNIARDYMDAHACEKISLAEISKVACLSVHHFKRSFHQLFGESPHRYLVKKRIEKAQQLLRETNLKTDEVCAATGFENASSFIRLFRHQNGVTPGYFRININ